MDILKKPTPIGKSQKIRSFDKLVFIFCDKEYENIKQLKAIYNEKYNELQAYFFVGDNNSCEFQQFCKSILNHKVNKPYGIIYSEFIKTAEKYK
jgi:hypothetical protein